MSRQLHLLRGPQGGAPKRSARFMAHLGREKQPMASSAVSSCLAMRFQKCVPGNFEELNQSPAEGLNLFPPECLNHSARARCLETHTLGQSLWSPWEGQIGTLTNFAPGFHPTPFGFVGFGGDLNICFLATQRWFMFCFHLSGLWLLGRHGVLEGADNFLPTCGQVS